jgi:mycothiol synthase
VSGELRAPTLDDVPVLLEFFEELRDRYDADARTETQVRDDLSRESEHVPENYRVAFEDGRVTGWVALWSPEGQPERGFASISALPREPEGYRRLLDWVESRMRDIGGGSAVRAQVSSEHDDEPLIDELRSRGYELARHFFEMEIDLAAEPEPPSWPEGIAVRTFETDDGKAVYEADMEAFEDHWDPVTITFEEWRDYFFASSDFDPDLWFLAEDGDQLAGFSLCGRRGYAEVGFVRVLGVRRPWRRRGLGMALLLHSLRELRDRGCPKARLAVDGESPTGAVRLYERAGMHVIRRTERFTKELL